MAISRTRRVICSILSVLILGVLLATHVVVRAINFLNCLHENIVACTTLIESFTETKENLAYDYTNRGAAYFSKNDYQKTVADVTKAIDLNPNIPEAFYQRGAAYNKMQKYNEAVSDYNTAIHLKPDYPEAFNNRGVILVAPFQQYSMAIADFSTAIRLKPDFAEAYFNRGDTKHKVGDMKGGDKDIATAKKLGFEDKQCSRPGL
jgi:tetratricopeptide (TPR) repeat protein